MTNPVITPPNITPEMKKALDRNEAIMRDAKKPIADLNFAIYNGLARFLLDKAGYGLNDSSLLSDINHSRIRKGSRKKLKHMDYYFRALGDPANDPAFMKYIESEYAFDKKNGETKGSRWNPANWKVMKMPTPTISKQSLDITLTLGLFRRHVQNKKEYCYGYMEVPIATSMGEFFESEADYEEDATPCAGEFIEEPYLNLNIELSFVILSKKLQGLGLGTAFGARVGELIHDCVTIPFADSALPKGIEVNAVFYSEYVSLGGQRVGEELHEYLDLLGLLKERGCEIGYDASL
jgi:hypothetical protein